MKSILITIFLLAFIPSLSFAVGSPDYLPNGPHPRIWLDTTTLANLNSLQDANDSRWTELETWCDAHLNDGGYDTGDSKWSDDNNYESYRMSGYKKYIGAFALGYMVLKDDNLMKANTYAAYVRNIIIDGIADSFSVGEEANNGLKAMRIGGENDITINPDEEIALGIPDGDEYKNGYSSRNLETVAMAYDWLYDYLSESDKTIIENMLLRWTDWLRGERTTYNNGVLYEGIRYYEDQDGTCDSTNICAGTDTTSKGYAFDTIGNNFSGGHAGFMLEVAVALYGETAGATELHAYLRDTYIPNTIVAAYDSDLRLSGSESSEGRTYYGGYEFSVKGLYAWETATGQTVLSDMDFSKNTVNGYIHTLYQDLLHVPIYGDPQITQGSSAIYPIDTFVGVNTYLHPSEAETGVGRWLIDNMNYPGYNFLFQELLWHNTNPTATVQSPEEAGLPLFYHAKGTGLVTMRSTWADTSEAVFSAIRLEGKQEASHENQDEGQFWIARGSTTLINRVNEANGIEYTSTVTFDNDHIPRAPELPPVISQAVIERVQNTTGMTYVRGDLSDFYDGSDPWHGLVAEKYVRSYLYIRPDIFIISDITKSIDANTNQKSWNLHCLTNPSVSGNTVTIINGVQKASVNNLYPTSGTYTTTYDSSYGDDYRVQYSVNSQSYDQFLNVIEVMGNADTPTATTLVTGSYVRGAKIGATVAMFTSNQDGDDVQSATYTVDATTHYIADLPVNTLIDVTRAGTTIVTDQDSGDAGIIEFSAASGSAEYVVTAGDYVPPTATCSDGIQNGDETGVDCGGSCDSCSDNSGGGGEIVPPTLHIK